MAKKVTIEQFAAILLKVPGELERRTVRALQKSAMRLVVFVEHEIRNAEPFPLVDRGRLVQSVTLIPHEKGAIVRVDAPYAPILEWGARPFTPPLAPLVEWATRKGLPEPTAVARAVQQKFRKQGMRPRRFFATAMAKWRASNTLTQEIQKALSARPPPAPGGGGAP